MLFSYMIHVHVKKKVLISYTSCPHVQAAINLNPVLVDLLLSLPQHIPPGYLLPKWPLYFSTFNLYLMHPASTVRQVTSVAFKYLGK